MRLGEFPPLEADRAGALLARRAAVSSAAGRCAKSARISSGDFSQCCGLARGGTDQTVPFPPMARSSRCVSKPSGAAKRTAFVATGAMPSARQAARVARQREADGAVPS